MSSPKKESVLRKIVKDFVKYLGSPQELDFSWIESHSTSPGAFDLNYCYRGREGWVELKAGPDIEVRATQVIWCRDRVAAGGHPLFLVEWDGMFHIVPGDRAIRLRADPSRESVVALASRRWTKDEFYDQFLQVLLHPEKEYGNA